MRGYVYRRRLREVEGRASSPSTTFMRIQCRALNTPYLYYLYIEHEITSELLRVRKYAVTGFLDITLLNPYFHYFRQPRQSNYGGNHHSSFFRARGITAPIFMELCPGLLACVLYSMCLYHDISGSGGSPPICDNSASKNESGNARKSSNIPQQKPSVLTVRKLGNHPVGGGGFADVWMGQLEDGTKVAIKVLRVFNPEPEFAVMNETIQREAKIWAKLDHPNILSFIGTSDVFQPQLALISPWMENGTIIQYVKRNAGVDRRKLIREIARGVQYLHSRDPSVVHGDLRANNILIDGEGNPKISDFGLARVLECNSTVLQSSYKAHGHFRWQAPELLNPDLLRGQGEESSNTPGHAKETDVYSFASVCLEVFTEQIPFADLPEAQALMEIAVHHRHPLRPAQAALERGLTDDIWDLMRKCWSISPRGRPNINQIVTILES